MVGVGEGGVWINLATIDVCVYVSMYMYMCVQYVHVQCTCMCMMMAWPSISSSHMIS